MRVAEEDVEPRVDAELGVLRHLGALVQVNERWSRSGSVLIASAIASRTASTPCPVNAGPFLRRGPSSWTYMRGLPGRRYGAWPPQLGGLGTGRAGQLATVERVLADSAKTVLCDSSRSAAPRRGTTGADWLGDHGWELGCVRASHLRPV